MVLEGHHDQLSLYPVELNDLGSSPNDAELRMEFCTNMMKTSKVDEVPASCVCDMWRETLMCDQANANRVGGARWIRRP